MVGIGIDLAYLVIIFLLIDFTCSALPFFNSFDRRVPAELSLIPNIKLTFPNYYIELIYAVPY